MIHHGAGNPDANPHPARPLYGATHHGTVRAGMNPRAFLRSPFGALLPCGASVRIRGASHSKRLDPSLASLGTGHGATYLHCALWYNSKKRLRRRMGKFPIPPSSVDPNHDRNRSGLSILNEPFQAGCFFLFRGPFAGHDPSKVLLPRMSPPLLMSCSDSLMARCRAGFPFPEGTVARWTAGMPETDCLFKERAS
jgi:hypothetical protein